MHVMQMSSFTGVMKSLVFFSLIQSELVVYYILATILFTICMLSMGEIFRNIENIQKICVHVYFGIL